MKILKDTIQNIALEIKTGKTPPTSNPEYFGEEVDWYTPSDLDKEKYLGKSRRGITDKAIFEKKAIVFKPNTVLIGAIGDIGKLGITSYISSSNQQITGIYTNPDKVDAQFFYYWLKAHKNLLIDKAKSAIVPILNNKDLGQIKVSFPEKLPDQLHIANILSKAENLIAQRKESIRLLDEFLKSTFLEMFGDPVRNEKGWGIKIFGDFTARITKGESPKWQGFDYLDSGIRFITSENVLWGSVDLQKAKFIHEDFHKKLKRSQLQERDLLVNLVGASVGRASLCPKEALPANINQAVAAITLNRELINEIYIMHLFLNPSFQKLLLGNVVEAARANLSLSDLRNLKFPVPSIELQTQFAQIVEKTEALKSQYQQSLQELEHLYGSLSQKAFRGEFMVKSN